MPAEVLRLDAIHPDEKLLQRAAQVLRDGGLVAFPTETVYGLGAHALDPQAVARIFAAKGRPAANPLIIHVASAADAMALSESWPEMATRLVARFWPGPLTIVVPRKAIVPDLVTAHGPTVGLRIPSHPVALALLRLAAIPLAAPSANRSQQLSPTRAEHVQKSLGDRVDLILDAGPCSGGLESTVVDVTGPTPRLLRPGLISLGELEAFIGPIAIESDSSSPARSPGQMARHYAPRTPLELVVAPGLTHAQTLVDGGLRVGWLAMGDVREVGSPRLLIRVLPSDPNAYAAGLYDVLHRLDAIGLDRIVIDIPPRGDAWVAIHDRLKRASSRL